MILYGAKCSGKIVTLIDGANEYIVPDCKIFGNGMAQQSTGIIIADQDRFYYIPLATPDIERVIDKMETICDKLKLLCGILGSANSLIDNVSAATGPGVVWTPSVATGTAIQSNANNLSTEVDNLKTEIDNIKKTLV